MKVLPTSPQPLVPLFRQRAEMDSKVAPLMLIRLFYHKLQILWPEHREFVMENHEHFALLDGDKMYTSVWSEERDYREETLVRDFATGKVLERMPGGLWSMPDGQNWILV